MLQNRMYVMQSCMLTPYMASDMVNLILYKPPTADSAVKLYSVWLLANTHSDSFSLMQGSCKVRCQVHSSF